jgi:hypothetical protein
MVRNDYQLTVQESEDEMNMNRGTVRMTSNKNLNMNAWKIPNYLSNYKNRALRHKLKKSELGRKL